MALGLSLLSAHLLASRISISKLYAPLALLFLCNAFTEIATLANQDHVVNQYPSLPRQFAILIEPLNLLLAPLFWVYVRGLTAKRSIVWRRQDLSHCIPALMSISIPILGLSLDSNEFIGLFERPRLKTSLHQFALISAINAFQILVLVQAAFYFVLIARRLALYREALSELFASTEHLELTWIRWLILFFCVFLFLSAVGVFADDTLIVEPWESLVDLSVLWFIAIWGLRQTAGLANEVAATDEANKKGGKYESSALSEQRLIQLANKIHTSMQQEKLYRDPDLSLRKVAKKINELPNYVSQALNRQIGESFFDYVNRWRIEEAKQKLSVHSDTVLAIAEATGFNSRSSFYNAFKKYTGQTPSAYRKALKQA